MNDILRWAKEADLWMTSDERIAAVERFAALVRADEREQCAKVCMEIEQSKPLSDRVGWEHGTVDCAAAIRARKES